MGKIEWGREITDKGKERIEKDKKLYAILGPRQRKEKEQKIFQ